MTLFDHYLEYMTQLMEGRRTPPEGITLPEGDMTEKVASLSRQLQQVGAFGRFFGTHDVGGKPFLTQRRLQRRHRCKRDRRHDGMNMSGRCIAMDRIA